jgi:hypothetical protein
MKLDRDEVYKLLDEGKKPVEVARILGCVRSVISYYKSQRNSPKRKGNNIPLTIKQKGKINELYIEGKAFNEIREITGFSLQTIRKYLIVPKRLKQKKRRTIYFLKWRLRKKAILVDYKGGKCEDCGYDECIEALHFHHLNPKEKEFNVCGKSVSIEKLKKEADKCVLLCANCHIKRHNCKTCTEALEEGKKFRDRE